LDGDKIGSFDTDPDADSLTMRIAGEVAGLLIKSGNHDNWRQAVNSWGGVGCH